ncbi:MAG: pantoate--beta-alanine ligase [Alphaproteobacteria bacterium]|nr:pantoate--beta-alanine ligase [Alphaproteobacteria bacterium]MDP7044949.1 pantoate--beta-alanine ligase [Alphaproteobacteria bacterium]
MTRNSGISVIRTVPKLRDRVSAWRSRNQRIGLVPTMGALHEGHLALVKRALETCDRVVVSLFVNPTQFGENEDLSTYPRDEAADRAILGELGVHVLYAPTIEEMYPQGLVNSVRVPELAEGLCGTFRPGHFAGVATVVTKLFSQSLPDMAVFGEKDYQQLQVIRGLVRDLDIPVHIEAVATVREADGLALSSRNAYLSPAERAIAPTLFRALRQAAAAIEAGGDIRDLIEESERALLEGGFSKVDYFEACDALTLKAVSDVHAPARVLAAAHLGTTRLIDNVAVAAGVGD